MAHATLYRLQAPIGVSRSQMLSDAELGAFLVRYVILPQKPDFDWADLEQLVNSGRLGGWWTDLKKVTWRAGKKASNVFTFGTGEMILDKLQSFVTGITEKSAKITEAGETAQGLLASLGSIFRAEQSTGAVSFVARNRTMIFTVAGILVLFGVWKALK